MQHSNVARIGLGILGIGALGGFIFSQTTRVRTSEYDHHTSEKEGEIELREYATAIVAQVEVEGSRMSAIDRGFTLLAEYIFGENTKGTKITMTTPVIQDGGPKKWTIQFILPEEYTLDTLPQPMNPLIAIREIPARQVAVIRFHGSSANDTRITDKIAELGGYIAEKELMLAGVEPFLAFYDPPWTLPFLRRNEVMVELQTAKAHELEEKETIDVRPRVSSKPRLAKKG